jgi:hypothetical protein
MGKFKEYLIVEQVGLGNLGQRIDNFMNNQWLGNTIGGALVSSDVNNTGTKPVQDYLQGNQENIDLNIPSVQKEGRITTLILKKNPIYVRLSDGTEAHFSYDEWKRIEGQPAVGKVMTITFQRHPEDQSQERSKIEKAVVKE